jgi:hypothetical protein
MIVPTSGASPPGRNSSRVEVNSRKRAAFASVCDRNVSSTTKPRFAIRIAGRSTSRIDFVPHIRSARSQVSGVPGTPTDRPLLTTSLKFIGSPLLSRNDVSVMRIGAVSRPSMVRTRPDRAS